MYKRQEYNIEKILPADPTQPYDVRDIIKAVADDSDFFEVQQDFAQNIVVGFGRVDGETIGFVANQPLVLAGVLDCDSADKAGRFIDVYKRQTYFQETDTIRLFDDCSYYNQLATTPGQLPRMLQGAIQTSLSRRGVSVIGIPGDLTGESQVNIPSSEINYPTHPRTCPSDTELQALADLLRCV